MLRGRQIVLRPIRPGDLEQHRRFLARVAARDLYMRFFTPVRSFSEAQLKRFTAIDYRSEMAFVATQITARGREETLGVGRACADRGGRTAEIALLVRSDHKRQGLGRALLHRLIRHCRARGVRRLRASVMRDNTPMTSLATSVGFRPERVEGNVCELTLELHPAPGPQAHTRDS